LRKVAVEGVLGAWSSSDPDAARSYYQQIPDERLREQLLTADLAPRLLGQDRDAAIEFARSLPVGPVRDRLLAQFGKTDEIPFDTSNEALLVHYQRAIYEHPEDTMRELLGRAATSEDDRDEIEEFLTSKKLSLQFGDNTRKLVALAEVDGVPDDDFSRRLLEQLTNQWAARDPSQARNWAEALPEGPARARALAGLAAGWAGNSSTEVTTWLDSLPPSPSRNAAVGAFASSVLERDPSTALTWLRKIPDPSAKFTALQNAWVAWSNRSPTAADHWRRIAPELTEAERSRLVSTGLK
jgi:hypothetical protein